jgi:hypothetical protein
MKEHSGKMILHYGFMSSDDIALPSVSSGFFSDRLGDMVSEVSDIFFYLKGML